MNIMLVFHVLICRNLDVTYISFSKKDLNRYLDFNYWKSSLTQIQSRKRCVIYAKLCCLLQDIHLLYCSKVLTVTMKEIEDSCKTSINCFSSVDMKFNNGFPLNGPLIRLYYLMCSRKYFMKWLSNVSSGVLKWLSLNSLTMNCFHENILKVDNKLFWHFVLLSAFVVNRFFWSKAATLFYKR